MCLVSRTQTLKNPPHIQSALTAYPTANQLLIHDHCVRACVADRVLANERQRSVPDARTGFVYENKTILSETVCCDEEHRRIVDVIRTDRERHWVKACVLCALCK